MSNGDPLLALEKRPAAPVQSGAFNSREWLSRLALLAALAGSLGLIWWSFTGVLAPPQRRAREIAATVARLSAEVDDMERRWTPEKARAINANFSQIQSHLFAGQAGLEAWLAGLNEQVVSLGLRVKTDFGQPIPQGAEKKLAVIPATISGTVPPPLAAPGGGLSPYQGLLQLTRHLNARPERVDLVEITVAGSAKSLTSAVLVLNLWAVEGGLP